MTEEQRKYEEMLKKKAVQQIDNAQWLKEITEQLKKLGLIK